MDTDAILSELQGILNAADGRSLTDAEADRYEELERNLQNSQRSEQIRMRDRAYRTPAPGQTEGLHGDVFSNDAQLGKAFENYLRTGQANADLSNLRVTNAQSEGVSTAGGYMVPTIMRDKIVDVQKAFGGIESVADSYSTGNGAPVEFPSVDDTANTGAITPENSSFLGGADLVFGTVTLGAYKYTSTGTGNSPLKVSVELAQDAAFDITGLVSAKLGERIARKEAASWATGTGVGEPQGLFATNLTQDNDVDVADTIDYGDIMDTYDLLNAAYEPNAVWLMKKNTWSQIRSIVDGNGRPLVQDALSGIGGTPTRNLLGFPVVIDESIPTFSSAGITRFLAFGDFRQAYVIRRVAPLVVVVNPYSSANSGQIEYTAWERADGNIQNRSAYVLVRNNT